MGFGVFMHKDGSIYDDIPEAHYQFPKSYLARAEQVLNDWIIYLEPAKEPNSKGFFAVAKINKIIAFGLPEDNPLPRIGDPEPIGVVQEEHTPFEVERPIVQSLVSRPFRDRAFRRAVMTAYDGRCAITGWKLVNGGGRPEADAAHIRPVEHGGPDSVRNGLALSGTAHWMFDRGLIGLTDNLDIMVSSLVNDRESITAILNESRKALVPSDRSLRPHPTFLNWHRENCFKGAPIN